jgi:penicillin-binding protein 2
LNQKVLEKRFNIMVMIVIGFFLLLIIRLSYLQLVKGDEYKRASENNRIQNIPTAAPRGVFYDRAGRAMVDNRPGFTVSYLKADKTEYEEERVFQQLREILGITEYTLVENQEYSTDKNSCIKLKKLPIGDMNDDETIDKDDIIAVDESGQSVSVIKAEIRTGKIELDVEPGITVYVTYSYDTIRNKIYEQGYKKYIPVRLKTDVNIETVSRIEEQQLPGVLIEVEPVRNYLYGEVGAHIFGYMGEIGEELGQLEGYRVGDFIGKTGLEKVMESYLRGTEGSRQVEVTAGGSYIGTLGTKEAVPGSKVYLTIDARVQETAENALKIAMNKLQNAAKPFPNAKKGSVVVLNVKTGEVLAMVSEPGYDPNLFASGIQPKAWSNLINNPLQPMFNKAISGLYPPGSIFKMVTATAALEEKVTTPQEIVYDRTGIYWTIAPKKNYDWNRGGHGPVNLATALAKSTNIYFYEMGRRAGIDAIEKYARMYGLGEKTGIELPLEKQGIVAGRDYKKNNFKRAEDKRWYAAETLDAAIGQGFHSYTPIEIASYIGTIANNGQRVKPHIIKKVVSPDGEVILEKKPDLLDKIQVSQETLDAIKQGMKAVTAPGGTAYAPFIDFPMTVAGKTGTAQWDTRYDSHGWFVSFAPFDDPEIAVAILIEQAGSGGSTGGPIARAIYETYFNIKPNTTVNDTLVQP